MEEENNPIEYFEGKPKNVFRYKNFTLAFLGALVSNLGNILYNFAVSFFILKLTDNNAFIQGAYLATGGIVYVLFTLFGGVISDRFHKGKIMYICDYLKGGVIIGFTLLLMFVFKDATAQVVVLFILAVITNIIAAIFAPAAASLMPHIVPGQSIQQAQSYYSAMQSSLNILGVVLAGILYSVLPINTFFIIVGVCYVLSGVSEMFIRYNHQKKEEKLTINVVFSDIGDGFKYLVRLKPIFYILGAILFVNFFFSPISSNFLPYFIEADIAPSDYLFKSFMEPEMWQSIFSVAMGIGMIVMALILSTKKTADRIIKPLRISIVIFVALAILLTTSYVLFANNVINVNALLITDVVIILLMGASLALINIPMTSKVMTTVDKEKLGKVSSVIDIGSQGLIPFATFLAGLVISGLGPMWLLIISTTGLALACTVILVNKQIGQL